MSRSPSLLLAAVFALGGMSGAIAQTMPDHPPHGDRMAMHKHRCDAGYAHRAGHLAEVEALLDLNAQQKPLWDKFKDTALGIAQARRKTCMSETPPDPGSMTLPDRMARMEKHLAEQEKALKTVHPALDALYAALNADQKKIMDHQAMPHPGKGMWRHGMGQGGHMGHPMQGMPGAPPPPPGKPL